MKLISTKIISILLALLLAITPVMVSAVNMTDCADMDMDMSAVEMSEEHHGSMVDSTTDGMNCHMDQCDMSAPCSSGTCAGTAFMSASALAVVNTPVVLHVVTNRSDSLSTTVSSPYRPPRA